MKKGITRFVFYINQLKVLLSRAAKQKNPALWLYNHNARAPIFMLEGLSKLYAGLHNKKKFEKLEEQFKLLEDILGAIDYYDVFAKELAHRKKIPATITTYLAAQSREKIQWLNEILKENHWLDDRHPCINKIKKKLGDAHWMVEKQEIQAIDVFYTSAITEINNFFKSTGHHFENVELEVHKLRRKLRWLSIYPQALRGCIQLSKSKHTSKFMTKYLTKEIMGSSFNKMPGAGDNKHFLLLEQNSYYALSWMISELAILKDEGLRVIAVKEAFQQTTNISDKEALQKTYHVLGKKQLTIKQILNKADIICKTYFNEGSLDKLIIGTSKVIK